MAKKSMNFLSKNKKGRNAKQQRPAGAKGKKQ